MYVTCFKLNAFLTLKPYIYNIAVFVLNGNNCQFLCMLHSAGVVEWLLHTVTYV